MDEFRTSKSAKHENFAGILGDKSMSVRFFKEHGLHLLFDLDAKEQAHEYARTEADEYAKETADVHAHDRALVSAIERADEYVDGSFTAVDVFAKRYAEVYAEKYAAVYADMYPRMFVFKYKQALQNKHSRIGRFTAS
jgi:hypothetical protein